MPTNNINCPNWMPMMGSTNVKNFESPSPVQNLTKPVMAKIVPEVERNHFCNECSARPPHLETSGFISSVTVHLLRPLKYAVEVVGFDVTWTFSIQRNA